MDARTSRYGWGLAGSYALYLCLTITNCSHRHAYPGRLAGKRWHGQVLEVPWCREENPECVHRSPWLAAFCVPRRWACMDVSPRWRDRIVITILLLASSGGARIVLYVFVCDFVCTIIPIQCPCVLTLCLDSLLRYFTLSSSKSAINF